MEKTKLATNVTIITDYFEEFFSRNISSPLTVSVYIFGLITGILGPLIAIWYERNCGNRFRTAINQMYATGSWYLLAYTLLVYIPDGIRFAYGPFGEVFCDIHVVTQNMLWPCLLLSFDAMIVLRYVFVFRMKNFAVINDDLLVRVLNFSIFTIATWTSFVRRHSLGRLPLHYYLCSGLDPNEGLGEGSYLALPPKYNAGRVIVVFSFLLHLLMLPKFIHHELTTRRKQRPIRLGTLQPGNGENIPNVGVPSVNNQNDLGFRNKNKTLFGLFTQLIILIFLLALGFVIRSAGRVEPRLINTDEYNWGPLVMLLYGPVAASTWTIIVVIGKNFRLREGAWRKIQRTFRRNQISDQQNGA
jgi:hypothetical protein